MHFKIKKQIDIKKIHKNCKKKQKITFKNDKV